MPPSAVSDPGDLLDGVLVLPHLRKPLFTAIPAVSRQMILKLAVSSK